MDCFYLNSKMSIVVKNELHYEYNHIFLEWLKAYCNLPTKGQWREKSLKKLDLRIIRFQTNDCTAECENQTWTWATGTANGKHCYYMAVHSPEASKIQEN